MVTTAETVDGYTAVFVFADSRVWAKKIREVELGQKVGFLLLQLLLNSSATDIVLVTLLRTAVERSTV